MAHLSVSLMSYIFQIEVMVLIGTQMSHLSRASRKLFLSSFTLCFCIIFLIDRPCSSRGSFIQQSPILKCDKNKIVIRDHENHKKNIDEDPPRVTSDMINILQGTV